MRSVGPRTGAQSHRALALSRTAHWRSVAPRTDAKSDRALALRLMRTSAQPQISQLAMPRLKQFKAIEDADFFESDFGLRTILSDLLPEHQTESVFASLAEWGIRTGGE